LTDIYTIAFEGLAHPYKENIVKFDGKTKIGESPEVKKTLLEVKST
jgi:large subunit ribosomal protein L13